MKRITGATKAISQTAVTREWHVVDMAGKPLGRVSNVIATLLQGKHKVSYAPYIDAGDYVVVVNSKKTKVTGRKSETKKYSYFSGYPGGLREVSFQTLLEKKPNEIIRHAVSGMLPKNKLRDVRLTRLYIFEDANHPYADKVKKS